MSRLLILVRDVIPNTIILSLSHDPQIRATVGHCVEETGSEKKQIFVFFLLGGDVIGGGQDCSPERNNQPDHGRRRCKWALRGTQEALRPTPMRRIDRRQSPKQADMLFVGGRRVNSPQSTPLFRQ